MNARPPQDGWYRDLWSDARVARLWRVPFGRLRGGLSMRPVLAAADEEELLRERVALASTVVIDLPMLTCSKYGITK